MNHHIELTEEERGIVHAALHGVMSTIQVLPPAAAAALIAKFAAPAETSQKPVDGTPITPEVLLAQARAFVGEHWGRFGFGPKLNALKSQNETLYHLVQSLVRNQ